MTEPSAKWNNPATIHAVKATSIPADAAMAANTLTKAKLVPCMIGNRAPMGPIPIV